MAGELKAALTQLRVIVEAVTGINAEPGEFSDDFSDFPFYEVIPNEGNSVFKAAQHKQSNHTALIRIHYGLPSVIRAGDLSTFETYYDDIVDALRQNPRLNDTANSIEPIIPYSYGELGYGGMPTVGYTMLPTFRIESAWNGTQYEKR